MFQILGTKHPWSLREAAHLLNRAGFGGPPESIAQLHALGMTKAVESLLTFQDESAELVPPTWLTDEKAIERQRSYFSERRKLNAIEDLKERAQKRKQLQREIRSNQREQTADMIAWWMKRMIETNHPLREKMTLFWHGHFATSLQKVKQPELLYRQNELFREHATGSFHKLTDAICEDPAMMLYLDTNQNKKGKPNENFARELLELFTLGEGNYTETDIKEAARAFTGYTIDRRRSKSSFDRRKHDRDEKTVLGATGNFMGDDIVRIALEQDTCARFLTTKLWEFFVAENPDKEIIDHLAALFRENEYAVRPVLHAIFTSKAFYDERLIRTHIKSPVQFLVQLARQLEIPSIPLNVVTTALSSLGQALFFPPNVAGWEGGKSWINTNTLLTRYNIAGLLVKGASDPKHMQTVMKGGNKQMFSRKKQGELRHYDGPNMDKLAPQALRETPPELVKALTYRLFQDDLTPKHRENFDSYAESKKDERFTDAEVAELLHLMMSTPYYQLT
ncbi:MAG: hypothetical protein ACI8T1_003480 [Verrucomicrobiales bacterium]|jgi:uncharacterized protein (DUF1800 family)